MALEQLEVEQQDTRCTLLGCRNINVSVLCPFLFFFFFSLSLSLALSFSFLFRARAFSHVHSANKQHARSTGAVYCGTEDHSLHERDTVAYVWGAVVVQPDRNGFGSILRHGHCRGCGTAKYCPAGIFVDSRT